MKILEFSGTLFPYYYSILGISVQENSVGWICVEFANSAECHKIKQLSCTFSSRNSQQRLEGRWKQNVKHKYSLIIFRGI